MAPLARTALLVGLLAAARADEPSDEPSDADGAALEKELLALDGWGAAEKWSNML